MLIQSVNKYVEMGKSFTYNVMMEIQMTEMVVHQFVKYKKIGFVVVETKIIQIFVDNLQ
jgi:hypothetical protein